MPLQVFALTLKWNKGLPNMTKGRVVRNNGSNSTNTHHYRQNNKPHINDCFNPDLKVNNARCFNTNFCCSIKAMSQCRLSFWQCLSTRTFRYLLSILIRILFKGQILGIMTAATRQDTITDK